MPRLHRGLVVLALLSPAAAVVPATQATAAGSFASCARVKDVGPTGADPADAVALRAKVTNCSTARRLARKWGAEVVRQSPGPVRIRSYVCRETQSERTGRISVRCTAGGGRDVRFKLG